MTRDHLTAQPGSAHRATVRFAELFGVPLPRGLRDEAAALSWAQFLARYDDSRRCRGPLRLRQWSQSAPAGATAGTYRATLAVGERDTAVAAVATGPIGALTAMLHDNGIAVEVLGFHQMSGAAGATATVIRGSDGTRSTWAMACDTDAGASARAAVIGCANRLLAPPARSG
ncbi:homocitrate synthase [Mycobacterium koreense]|uniref:Uncharacterized protein n=1 Tax=Mycolicibacillus koreensis TaxID=1069220 RepID=A0A7I7SCE2_9MYCO|nr:hypothetical protein [Mycolicibacillus koreensis]MCV7249063.1 homocitrate synthase [Mycolicibacillus koreensis]OSC34115.1 hypothetical protein B8W67_08135 [Mycolicibacillus koreensis]BBY54577.1 hypothetical protein MKOR_18280 [Mycolicibacillus koreensis]